MKSVFSLFVFLSGFASFNLHAEDLKKKALLEVIDQPTWDGLPFCGGQSSLVCKLSGTGKLLAVETVTSNDPGPCFQVGFGVIQQQSVNSKIKSVTCAQAAN